MTPGTVVWMVSPWDEMQHAFRMLGIVASEALCKHSALTERLSLPQGMEVECQICMLLHGTELAERHGHNRWRL